MVSHEIHNNTFKNGRRELRGALQLAVERPLLGFIHGVIKYPRATASGRLPPVAR